MTDKVLVFDVLGDFGFFKTPEVTRATLSFPFTRTSIIGLIGAMIGKEKNSYWEIDDPLGNSEIAIQLLNLGENSEFQHAPLTVNYAHTKYTVNIGGRSGTLKTYLSDGEKRGFVTDVKLDLLRDVHYRIYYKLPEKEIDQELYDKLKRYLKNNWSIFPTYLGHANLLADIIYIGEYPIKKIPNDIERISSVIPVSCIDQNYLNILERKVSIIMNIPIRMEMKDTKIVNTFGENFILPGGKESNLKIKVKNDVDIYSVEIKIADNKSEVLNIIFIPNGKDLISEEI
ncbi:MAG: putative Type I-B CRISPR-associated protein Cas5 [Promethearchaeota archaeon]|jgi:CRISPR-associated protein Cas5 subtype I-B|nr:MAG: putative Type I-B CRISPR-associated protein Cas5 [Candidatus Lokiarchaeota archaeon]